MPLTARAHKLRFVCQGHAPYPAQPATKIGNLDSFLHRMIQRRLDSNDPAERLALTKRIVEIVGERDPRG